MRKLTAVVSLLVLGATLAVAQGTTYTQTTHACILTQCSDAQFTPSATLTYGAFFKYCGEQNVNLVANWNGEGYTQGKASMHFIGRFYNSHDYEPWAVWELSGTFNNGTRVLTEHVATYRTCAGGINIDGSVVAQ